MICHLLLSLLFRISIPPLAYRISNLHVGLNSWSIEAMGKPNGESHRWFQLYWYTLPHFLLPSSRDNAFPFPLPPFPLDTHLDEQGPQ